MQKGFTLIEILAASVLITLVAVGTFSVFESGANLLTEARLRTEAALLAQSVLEDIINTASTIPGYASLTEGPVAITVPEYFVLSKRVNAEETYYIVDNISTSYKKITVNISWYIDDTQMREEFITLVFNPNYWE